MYITFICVSSLFRLQLSLSRTKSQMGHCDINKIDSIFTVVYNMSYFLYCYAPVRSLFFFSFLQQLSGCLHFTVLGNDMIAVHSPLSWIMSLGGIKVLCLSLMAQIPLFTVLWYQMLNNGLFKSFFCWSTQLSRWCSPECKQVTSFAATNDSVCTQVYLQMCHTYARDAHRQKYVNVVAAPYIYINMYITNCSWRDMNRIALWQPFVCWSCLTTATL